MAVSAARRTGSVVVVGATVGGLVLDVGGAVVVGATVVVVVGAVVVGLLADGATVAAVVDGLVVADEQAVASSVSAAAPMSAVRVVMFMVTIFRPGDVTCRRHRGRSGRTPSPPVG